jgi:hypothetical protein
MVLQGHAGSRIPHHKSRLVVVRDYCADPDAEVHAMLLDVVIAKQAAVVTMAEFAGALPGKSS